MIPVPLTDFWALRSQAYAIPRVHHDNLMAALATFIGARCIVELGTGPGYATRVFLDVVKARGGHLWSVDIGDTVGRDGLRDDPAVTFVTSDSAGYAATYDGPRPDLVYADSDHSKAHVLAELRAWAKRNPRLMAVDDTLDPNGEHGSPLEAAVQFCAEAGWQWWNIPIHTGICILVPPEAGR